MIHSTAPDELWYDSHSAQHEYLWLRLIPKVRLFRLSFHFPCSFPAPTTENSTSPVVFSWRCLLLREEEDGQGVELSHSILQRPRLRPFGKLDGCMNSLMTGDP